MNAAGSAVMGLRKDRDRRRIGGMTERPGAAFQQHVRTFHRHRRAGIIAGARWIPGALQAGYADFPIHPGVIRFEFLVADRPIGEIGAGD